MAVKNIELALSGMHCAACSSRIERVVAMQDGVAKITVSLASHTGQVELADGVDENAVLAEILETITNLGFGAEVLVSDGSGVTFLSEAAERWKERETAQLAELAERKRDLVPAFAFALPLLLLSMGEMAGVPLPEFLHPAANPACFAVAQLLLCLPVVWSGRRFYLLGIPALFRKSPTMDTLVALGTGAAFLFSLWNTLALMLSSSATRAMTDVHTAHASMMTWWNMFFGTGVERHGVELYYESAAVVIALVSLGKYLESRSSMRTSEAMKGLLNLAPEMALRLASCQGKVSCTSIASESASYNTSRVDEVFLASVRVGDVLLVRPGGRIPVDGVVLSGESHVDESMLTGESMPVIRKTGDKLAAGTMNRSGALVMQAEKIGGDTVLARIIKLVQEAQGSKAPIASIADRVSLYFVPAVIVIAVIAGLCWATLGADTAFGLRVFVSVMVIACPCAMGLATPMSIMVAAGRGAQLGYLFKNGQALENAAHITTMVFDKTGTLTEGRPEVVDVHVFESATPRTSGLVWNERLALGVAASLEVFSEHPLGAAIVRRAKAAGGESMPGEGFTAIPGKGVYGKIFLPDGGMSDSGGKGGSTLNVALGSITYIVELCIIMGRTDDANMLQRAVGPYARQGKTPVILLANEAPVALFAIADPLRQESPEVLRELTRMGISSVMLTGDVEVTAKAVAKEAGIDRVIAGVLPEGKEQVIARLKDRGEVVGMVGDGINDAPALARAAVGFAVSSGIDVAVEAGDVVLMQKGLTGLCGAIGLGRATMRNIRQNLFWAFAFNIVGIPFAAGVFHIWGGPVLSPMLAGTAMAMSSVSVVSNALRLRFYK